MVPSHGSGFIISMNLSHQPRARQTREQTKEQVEGLEHKEL
jgi:hypothetical protein